MQNQLWNTFLVETVVLRIQIRWIRNILASWIRIQVQIRKNMRIHGSESKVQNSNQKLEQNPNLLKKKRDYQKFRSLNVSYSFSIKITEKKKEK